MYGLEFDLLRQPLKYNVYINVANYDIQSLRITLFLFCIFDSFRFYII